MWLGPAHVDFWQEWYVPEALGYSHDLSLLIILYNHAF